MRALLCAARFGMRSLRCEPAGENRDSLSRGLFKAAERVVSTFVNARDGRLARASLHEACDDRSVIVTPRAHPFAAFAGRPPIEATFPTDAADFIRRAHARTNEQDAPPDTLQTTPMNAVSESSCRLRVLRFDVCTPNRRGDETCVGFARPRLRTACPITQTRSGRAALASVSRGRSGVGAHGFAKAFRTAEIASFDFAFSGRE